MDGIYKVFGGVIVGFVLSPLSEIIKYKIISKQHRNKLINKIIIHRKILASAIPTLDKTIKERGSFIQDPFNYNGAFVGPNLNFPNIESSLDNAYDSLSPYQRERMQILLSQATHMHLIQKKIEKLIDELHELIRETQFDSEHKLRALESKYYSRIISSEDAMLATAIFMYINTASILRNKPTTKSDNELMKDALLEFKIDPPKSYKT